MYYEINVSRYGYHFFATDPRSITDMAKLRIIILIFKNKFPESEGYEIKVTKFESTGKTIKI